MRTKYQLLGPQIRELAAKNLTSKEIATQLRVGRNFIDKFAKENNLQLKDGRGASYKKEEFPCVICQKLFHVKRYRYENGISTTCSKECSNLIRSRANPKYAKKTKQCITCKKDYLVKPSRANKTSYCSIECSKIVRVEQTCKKCGKAFIGKPGRQYCTVECSNHKQERLLIKCELCHREFRHKLSEERIYCSKDCHNKAQLFHHRYPEKLQEIKQLVADGFNYVEIAKKMGYASDSHISRIASNNNIQNKYVRNASSQEKKIKEFLSQLLNESIEPSGKYPNYPYMHDGICSLGYIEYDGKGGHYRPDQEMRDQNKDKMILDRPIVRISPQGYHGGVPYLSYALLNKAIGYCAAIFADYKVLLLDKNDTKDRLTVRELLRDCHPLGQGAGSLVFVLKFGDHIIGAAKWGLPVDKLENGLELRRFFVLDGTPKNTESWFLSKCVSFLPTLGYNRLITYCHEWEKASYLTATGWKEISRSHQQYDFYKWNGKIFSKRVWWQWAKEAGLVDLLGTEEAKKKLAEYLGAEIIYEGTKRKFLKNI